MLDNLIIFPAKKLSSTISRPQKKMSAQPLTVHDVQEEYVVETTGHIRSIQQKEELCLAYPTDRYVKVSDDLSVTGLSSDEIRVLQALIDKYRLAKTYHKVGKQGEFVFPNELFHERFRMKPRKARQIVGKLKEMNLISTMRRGRYGKEVMYRIDFDTYYDIVESSKNFAQHRQTTKKNKLEMFDKK